ncbi:MAG: hypothetical protein JNL01_07520 [Bdellovibrionales bacterium]|nr:hypothetical protein [Bdellovibrionales bacterium]
MKNLNRIWFAATLVFFVSPAVHAELWQGANQVRPKEFVAGAFGTIGFSPSNFRVTAQGIYGFGSKAQGELRLSAGDGSAALGGYFKHHFLSTDLVNIALWAGARIQSGFGLEGALIMSHAFPKFELYFGPIVSLFFGSGSSVFGMGAIPGVSIPISNKLKFYGEAALSLVKYQNAVSGGVRFYF